MNQDEIKVMLGVWLPSMEHESKITRRVIAAVPDDKKGYRPAPKSMSAFDLAWHTAHSDIWFLRSIAAGSFDGEEESSKPAEIKSINDIVAWYDKNFAAALEEVKGLSLDQAMKPVSFFGMYNYPAARYLSFALAHTTHHRGQLSAYLRPLGAKVPSIYGGSADEPMSM